MMTKLVYSYLAAVATEAGLFIKHDGTVCGAGDTAVGVSLRNAEAGEAFSVALDGIVEVQAGGSFSAGDFVKSDANGKAVAAEAGDTANGIALEDGSDGATVPVKIVTVAVNPAAEAAEETPAETPADPSDPADPADPSDPADPADPSDNPGQE